MVCPKCKRECEGNSRYCPYCGTAISAAVTVRHKGKKGIVAVSVCLFLCLVALGVFWYLNGQGIQSYIGTEKGTALTDEEAECILLSDISDEDWEIFEASNEKLSQIVANYSDENGYISSEETETVINAVAKQVEELYEEGIVTYYFCASDAITFEYACGLIAYYEPDLEGYSSGNGSMDIMAIDPFATRTANDDMKNQARQSGNNIYNALADGINGGVSMVSYKDEEVTVSQLKDLEECTFFLWNGHGGMVIDGDEEYPILYTRQKATGKPEGFSWPWSANAVVSEIEEDGSFWAITPYFVEKYFKIEDGFVYLSACHSGENDTLASAFMDAGAEIVFVNAGEGAIDTKYTQNMMELIIAYMCGWDDIFHTANEALELAGETLAEKYIEDGSTTYEIDDETVVCDTLDEFIEKINGGSHTELRGEGEYTICSCIRGEITFEDDLTQDEIDKILEGLTVRLETEDGQLVYDVSANMDATFYFNNLDSGTTYTTTLYQNEKQICQPVSVTTVSHRYSSVSIPYSMLVQLEGYVYDQDGMPLEGVSVAAEMDAGNDLWSATTVTDSNGYYSLEVYGENTYALTYSKSGYVTQNNNFNISSEIFANAQEGVSCQMEDVILEKEMLEKETFYLEDMEIIDSDQYSDNLADSFVYKIGQHANSRGNVGTDGQLYEHGIECWIARWNYKEEISWAYSVFQLNDDFKKLEGYGILIDSYNTTDFDSTLEIYGDDTLLFSYHLTPSTIPFDINIDIENVTTIKIYVYDNESKKGGTSFGLIDMKLS